MSKYKKLVVDIDGTLCADTRGLDYETAPPKLDVIKKVNEYASAGYHITIFTARGMYRYNENVDLCDQNLRTITEDWLCKYGVIYDRLLFGKPSADIYIDDKGMRPDEFAMASL